MLALVTSFFLAAAGGGSSGFSGGGGGGGGGFSGGGGGGYGGSGGGTMSGGAFLGLIVIVVIVVVFIAIAGFIANMKYRKKKAARVKQVRLASAEAADDDAYFASDVVEKDGAALFVAIQQAWDARDEAALSKLAGKDLMVEWKLRLADFQRKGLHNRVVVRTGPKVEYVGLTNRDDDTEDRAVIRIEAGLDDWCVSKSGADIFHNGATSAATSLVEYWTLARSSIEDDAHWVLLSIEQRAEGDHQLDGDIIASPWGDNKRIGAAATFEVAAADGPTEGFTTADLVDPGFAEDARAAALDLSLVDPRFGPDVILACVSNAVEAWVEAVDGPDDNLQKLATPAAIQALLHPGDTAANPHTRLVVRGPKIERIDVQALRPTPEPAEITVAVSARGRRYIEDRDTVAVLSGSKDSERSFVEYWTLALTGDATSPWLVTGTAGVRE